MIRWWSVPPLPRIQEHLTSSWICGTSPIHVVHLMAEVSSQMVTWPVAQMSPGPLGGVWIGWECRKDVVGPWRKCGNSLIQMYVPVGRDRLCLILWHVLMPPITRGQTGYANPCRCQLCQTLGGIYITVYIEDSMKKTWWQARQLHVPQTVVSYTGCYSVVLKALVGADYKIIWADIGGMVSASDAHVDNASELKECIEGGSLGFTDPDPLPNDNQNMAYFFVGDDAFALRVTRHVRCARAACAGHSFRARATRSALVEFVNMCAQYAHWIRPAW